MDDKSAQEEEICALKSIYEENDIFTIDEADNIGSFYVKLETESKDQFYTLNFGNYIFNKKDILTLIILYIFQS
jgi:hypothetical protein